MQLEELAVFIQVVDSGNFSRAAQRLGVTSSVASRTVKKLEAKLATALFHRTTRKVVLTQEGRWLYDHAQSLVSQATGIEAYLADRQRAPSGTLVIDAATPFSLHAIAPLLPGFNRRYPQITLTLQSNESNVDLIERRVDVAIRIGALSDSSLRARKLGACFRHLYASPAYLDEHGIPATAAELERHVCLGFTRPDKLNHWPLTDERGDLVKIRPDIYADNGETLKQLAINGAGIACLSSFTTVQDVAAGRLRSVLVAETVARPIPVYAVFYADSESDRRLRCFLDYLDAHLRFS